MGKHILIVDDDKDLLELLSDVFNANNYKVTAIDGTSDILSDIEKYQPDIVLLDYILNDINGGELCHQIKTNKATAHLPVIIFSAYSRVIRSLGNYGCDDFIEKPFDLNDLIASINKILNNPVYA